MTNPRITHANRSVTSRGTARARALAALAVVVSITALSGCGLRVVDTTSSQPPSSEAPSKAPTTPTDPASDPPESTDPTTMPSRSDFTDQVSQTLSCTSEPLDVSAIGVVVELTGDCGDVTISSSGAVVLADTVDSLTITGVGNTVLVNSVTLLGVTGDANVVLWGEDAPTIDDSGVSNVLTKERS